QPPRRAPGGAHLRGRARPRVRGLLGTPFRRGAAHRAGPDPFLYAPRGDVPRLRTFACFPERSTTDDSPPSGVAPPSMYRSTWSPRCSRGAPHVRGAGGPCRFALVEVIGPMGVASTRGVRCRGLRSATRPSRVTFGGRTCAVAWRTAVR